MLIKKLTKQLNFKEEKFPVQKKPTQNYKNKITFPLMCLARVC